MKRLLTAVLSTAVATTALLLPPTAASAASDSTSTIANVSPSWASGRVAVRFAYDTWDYGRVDVLVDGVAAASSVLPTFSDGTRTIGFDRAATAGAAPIVVTVTSCDSDPADPAASCTTKTAYAGSLLVPRPVPTGKANALTLLNRLTVKNETHAASYSRTKFKLWVDANRDGENTRAEVLKAESSTRVTINGNGTVKTGKWLSQYDGKTITVASKLDIDHLVPLEEAWTSGASAWTAKKREAYANDLGYGASLIAVSQHANRSKGDKDPASWLPTKSSYRCAYVRNYIAVKSRWGLTIDSAEKAAMTNVLATCSSYAVVKPAVPVLSKLVPPPAKRKLSTRGSSSGGSGSTSGTDPRYATCTELLKHPNHAPYRRGVNPEYNWYQDRDHDGLVCE